MYQRAVDRYLERFSSDYELTDEQRERVRARLQELKAKQYEYAKPRLEEIHKLREEMIELWHKRREGQAVDEKRLSEVRERMHELWRGSPLLNHERATESVEQLLPAAQVEKGRLRQQQRRDDWRRRREEFRSRRQQQRSEREQRAEQEERSEREGRWSGGGRGDPWDRYVESFASRYQLDESQRVAARSILRTLKERRDAYRASHRDEFDGIRGAEDPEQRRERYEELNEPIERLFDELKDRLMKLPTSAQIALAEQSQPTSRPAETTSRSAATSSSGPSGPNQ